MTSRVSLRPLLPLINLGIKMMDKVKQMVTNLWNRTKDWLWGIWQAIKNF